MEIQFHNEKGQKMVADVYRFNVSALADGLKIAAPTSTAVYYKIILPTASILNGSIVNIDISSSCMESGSPLSFSGVCNISDANSVGAVTFAYDTTSVRIVEWSVE